MRIINVTTIFILNLNQRMHVLIWKYRRVIFCFVCFGRSKHVFSNLRLCFLQKKKQKKTHKIYNAKNNLGLIAHYFTHLGIHLLAPYIQWVFGITLQQVFFWVFYFFFFLSNSPPFFFDTKNCCTCFVLFVCGLSWNQRKKQNKTTKR